jgi:hypothetical protein
VEYKTSGPIEGLKGGLKWCCCYYCMTGAACCVKQGCRRAVFWFGMVLRVLSAPLSLSLQTKGQSDMATALTSRSRGTGIPT